MSSPPQSFDANNLKPYIKQKLSSTLSNVTWDKDKDRVKDLIKEIGDRVKENCLRIGGKNFKYIVLTQINENAGQGGTAGLSCHWEEQDVVCQEIFSTESIICICIVFAIRIAGAA